MYCRNCGEVKKVHIKSKVIEKNNVMVNVNTLICDICGGEDVNFKQNEKKWQE